MASAAATPSIRHFVFAGVATAGRSSNPRTHHHVSSSWKGVQTVRLSGGCWKANDARDRLSVCAVIEKPTDNSSDCDPERVVLERMYLISPQLGGKTEELGRSEVVINSADTSQVLRKTEQERSAAETRAKSDNKDAQNAKSAFVQGKKELEAAHTIQKARKEKLSRQQKQLAQQMKELKDTKRLLKEQQRRIQSLQEQVCEKHAELSRSKSSLSEKDDNLSGMKKLLKVKDSQLQSASLTISQQSAEVDQRKTCLKEKENELRRSEEERFLKQEQLSKTEIDLEKQVVAYLGTKEELKSLKQELIDYKAKDLVAKQDLEQANFLLNGFRGKLEDSQRLVTQLRVEVKEQGLQLKHQREEMSSQEATLASHVLKLEQMMSESKKQNKEIRIAKISYKALQSEIEQEKERVLELRKILDQEKATLRDSVLEVNSLKRNIQQLESRLSDTQIALQLKEAELVTAKLEIHQLKPDLDSLRFVLTKRDHDLQITRKVASELELEVDLLKFGLRNEQEKHAEANDLLRDKEDQLKEVQLDFEATKVKVLEATAAVREIAEFSKILAESSNERQYVSYESSVVMETNQELFAANCSLLEREPQFQSLQEKALQDVQKKKELEEELQEVKRCLEEKHMELEAVSKSLAGKEYQLNEILRKWEEPEEERAQKRNEIKEEAKSLAKLHLLYGRHGERLDGTRDGTSREAEIELEFAKRQFQTAIASMQQLVELSQELVESTNINAPTSSVSAKEMTLALPHTSINVDWQHESMSVVNSESLNDVRNVENYGVSSHDEIKLKLGEQDEAIENTKQALSELMKLTERLVAEAGIVITRDSGNGCFSSNVLSQSACS